MISVFDLFSIGIGPSSSHTVGPMRAAFSFMKLLDQQLSQITRLKITVFGSLAFTGVGHGTDKALLMGLEGELPESINPNEITERCTSIFKNHAIHLLGQHKINFSLSHDLIYDYEKQFAYHPNAMTFTSYNEHDVVLREETYFSIGGGFIVNQADIGMRDETTSHQFPFPFNNARELIQHCQAQHLTIAELMLANEKVWRDEASIRKQLLEIDQIMQACIEKGCHTDGELPGKLHVKRRAPDLYRKLLAEGKPRTEMQQAMNWLNVYAMAVNEENAAGGRVVTAPTNGAAGIIPSVLNYYKNFYANANEDGIVNFLLTAGAIGLLYKKNASISGAEMGCQGEVGVACSMAAAALTAVLNGTVQQVENAAEIGMEHNLGLTCDPVDGLVQIPCIERNAMASVKAVNAAQLALAGNGNHKISLDMVINTMREIGNNMNVIYKETSQGGLAVAVSLSEC